MKESAPWYRASAIKNARDLRAEGFEVDMDVVLKAAGELCTILRCANHAHLESVWPARRKVTREAIERDMAAWRVLVDEARERLEAAEKLAREEQEAKNLRQQKISRLAAQKMALEAMQRKFGLGPDWKPPTD